MNVIRATLATIILAAGMSAALAQPVKIAGTYTVQGTNADGSPYEGTAIISVTSKNTCRIVWSVGSDSSGICMRNGPALAASYIMGQTVGLVIYQIMEDGTLKGVWTVADQEGVGTEVLTPQ